MMDQDKSGGTPVHDAAEQGQVILLIFTCSLSVLRQ